MRKCPLHLFLFSFWGAVKLLHRYSPDGGYIPRILFLNSAGEVQTDVFNKAGSDQYKFYYSDSGAVVKGMQDAAKHFA